MPKNQYAIARRSIWYLLRTLLVIALIVVLCLTAFVTAMHISNIYILVTEGLELRAGYILQGGEIAPLTEYFTENFIAQDPALYAGTYSSFNVTNFIYKIEVKSLLTLPGDSTATVTTLKVPEDLILDENGNPVNYTKKIVGKGTAYSARSGAKTASGRYAIPGHVAVNPNVIPYGSKLYIKSVDGSFIYGYAIAADTGIALMDGRVTVDLFFDTYLESCLFGAKTMEIYVIG